jgi:flagellar hook-associated protein FlgK
MGNFSIGLSGLEAAQRALDIIGNNVANAATPGYHKQRLNLAPAYSTQTHSVIVGGGVKAASVIRLVDSLLEKELLRQNSQLEQISQEYTTLKTVENAFGELSTDGGLNSAIDALFNSFSDLSNHIDEIVWQQQVVTSAETMTSQFRTLGDFLSKLDTQITLEADNLVERANILINQIAALNDDIEHMELGGSTANNLRDERDQLVAELSEILEVEVVERSHGVVDVEAGGIAVVIGTNPNEIEVGTTQEGSMGLGIAGTVNFVAEAQSGRLGSLMSLKNSLVGGIRDDLDTLALALINQVNQTHVQGVGSAGSFASLDGWPVVTEVLADWEPPITDGKIYIRVTDTSSGAITRNEIDLASITPSVPAVGLTLSDVASEIDAITGLNSWVDATGLHIEQSSIDYEFDFIPAVLPEPTNSTLTAGAPPGISVSGIYTGTENDTFTFTVSGAGSVGNGSLELAVTNGAGQTVKTLNIGEGYAVGDVLEVGNGIRISLSTGDFVAGDNFEVDAFYSTDTSGLLAAAGMNTFFSGTGAEDIAVCSDIVNDPTRIATSLGPEMTDNCNALCLAQLADEPLSSLGDMSVGIYYRNLVADVGQQITVREIRQENVEVIVQNLQNQRDEISGVDVNEEAAQLMIFQQMFQTMAKYMDVLQTTIESVMSII